MVNNNRFMIITAAVLSVLLLITGCATGTPSTGDTVAGMAAAEKAASLVDPSQVVYPAMPDIPEATRDEHITRLMSEYDGGIINFNTFHQPHEIYAGLQDPDVKSAELYVKWYQLEPEDGVYDWSIIDDAIALWSSVGKTVEFRVPTSDNATNITPAWVFDEYFIRRITVGQWFDFELPEGGYELLSGAEKVSDEAYQVNGRWSVAGSSKKAAPLFRLKKNRKLDAGKVYSVQLDYKAIEDGIYYVRLLDSDGGQYLGDASYWKGTAGTSASFSTTLRVPDDAVVEIGIANGSGHIAIDNISVQEYTGGFAPAAYPQIFDERFKALYARFVKALGNRYAENPAVAIVQVGPVGRWDEVMLDSSELTNGDAYLTQWNRYGYTDELFLEHIGWAMDLYRHCFPNSLVRINTAYGQPGLTDAALLWRRTGQLAFEKGVQIKQNGLQEKFFGYPGRQSFPWSAEKVKPESWGNVTYETAGQLYRNDTGIGTPIGHPITMFNNAIMQGADALFLYSDDVLSMEVGKYTHYLQESLGSRSITNYYARFGSWPVYGEQNTFSMTWDNIWMKMRPLESPESQFLLTEKDGEKCAVTDDFVTSIVLDLTDRAAYQNLSGAVYSVEYFDEGTDSFTLSIYNRADDSWFEVGRVDKEDTGAWRLASFIIPDGLWDYDLFGGDAEFGEVKIDALDDGKEYIRLINIETASLNEFAAAAVIDEPSNGDTKIISEPVSVNFSTEAPVDRIRIPLYTEEHVIRNMVEANLYGVSADGSEQLLENKGYEFFTAGEVWEIPLRYSGDYRDYRLELVSTAGNNGIYLTAEGTMAYEVCTFRTAAGTAARSVISSALPIRGLEAAGAADGSKIALYRLHAEGEKQLVRSALVKDGKALFTPVAQGRYEVEHEGSSVRPLSVVIRYPERKAVRLDAPDEVADLLAGDVSLKDLTASGNTFSLTGESPLISAGITAIEAESFHRLFLSLRNGSAATLMRVFWAGADEEFSAGKSYILPVVSNDTVVRDYIVPFDLIPSWDGEVAKIALQPADGSINAGTIEIETLMLGKESMPVHRSCDTLGDALYAKVGKTQNVVEDGKLIIRDAFGSVDTSRGASAFVAHEEQEVVIDLINHSSAFDFDLVWTAIEFDAQKRKVHKGSILVHMDPESEEVQSLHIPVGDDPAWKGRVTVLGITFFNDYGEEIEILDLSVQN